MQHLPPLQLDRQKSETLTYSFYDTDSRPTWH